MKKTVLWSVVGVLAVLLLAGAAFLGMRWMNAQASGQPFDLGSLIPGGGGAQMTTFTLEMDPAKELPVEKADVHGVISEKKDNSLMIGTNPKMSGVVVEGEGEPVINTEIQGPTYEVVVTKETKIYRDATFDDQMPQSGEKVQQVVAPITFEEIPNNAFVSAWGDKRGDRVIATVLMVSGGGVVISQ